ncbi:uncharacterized protein TNCV_4846051 [Trichonephila clavipes]|nr:uncharacterized protein TNCV_4846051 [Trichonephila clavipes]
MNKPKSSDVAESLYEIKQRYEDTALVLYKERLNKSRPLNFLSIGDSRRSYAYSCYGNSAIVVGKKGGEVTKSDEKPIQSHICTIL